MKPTKHDYLVIKHLCGLTQEDLLSQMHKFLAKHYQNTWVEDYAVFAEGEIPVTLVAHLDTVFEVTPDDFYFDGKKGVLWSPQGLGADDRAGVFGILKLISLGFKPNILLVTDEELGCVGAEAVVKDYPTCPFESNFIIELDRRGRNDCVFYNCGNTDFMEYIETFGFETKLGSFSDISVLAPKWDQAAVNLSVGYFNEHSYHEYLNVNYLFETIEKVTHIFEDCDTPYSYMDAFASYCATESGGWTLDDVYGNQCTFCGEGYQDYDVMPIDFNGRKLNVCLECLSTLNVQWCTNCNTLYYVADEANDDGRCFICKEEAKNGKGN